MFISAILLQEIGCITDVGYIFFVLMGLKDPPVVQLPDEPLEVLRFTFIGL